MKTRGNYFILAMVLTIFLFCSYAQANQPERPKRNLQFKTSGQPIQWETNELGRIDRLMAGGRLILTKRSREAPKGIGITEPNYAASFMVRNDRIQYGSGQTIHNILLADFNETFAKLAKHSMSKRQNIFLTQQASSHMAHTSERIYVEYKLYAVTKEDARKMAETTLEWLDDKAYTALQQCKNENENLKSELGKAKERISKIHSSLEYWNKIKKTTRVFFRIDDKSGITVNYDNLPPADIQSRALEYDKMLNLLEIDIAGHEAKIRMLRDYMGKGDVQTQSLTHQMLIQEEVELAGAMARRQAIISPVKVMNEYLDAIENIRKLEQERKTLEEKVTNLQQALQKSEETLSDPPGYMRPVEVFMNRITIHPVWKEEDKSD